MQLREYQRAAKKTDQFPKGRAGKKGAPNKAELVPLLGLTGEVGALLAEYKKLLRDGPIHLNFHDRLGEELGDILWYVATVATKFGLDLERVAQANLDKVDARWSRRDKCRPFDVSFPHNERLPQQFTLRFAYAPRKDGSPGVALLDRRGKQIGDLLTDNAHQSDGYRFHDVMHFAFVAVLGWSPVARKLLGAKRKSKKKTDEVEDGGRAGVIDEAIVAMIFDYIRHNLAGTKGLRRIDSETLRSIRALTRGFEVHERTEAEWEDAIIKGLNVWRQVEAHDGGTVVGDFRRRLFTFRPPSERQRPLVEAARPGLRKAPERPRPSDSILVGRIVATVRGSR
jgi:NTP pyrophosphatase (non-canonical NTP hydrolase)